MSSNKNNLPESIGDNGESEKAFSPTKKKRGLVFWIAFFVFVLILIKNIILYVL